MKYKTKSWCQLSRNNLTTLKGSPFQTGGGFYISSDVLETLEGGPEEVGDEFRITCNHLISLKGAPEEVGGDFDIRGCGKLDSLEYSPGSIEGDYIVGDNGKIFTEDDIPDYVNYRYFVCDLWAIYSATGYTDALAKLVQEHGEANYNQYDRSFFKVEGKNKVIIGRYPDVDSFISDCGSKDAQWVWEIYKGENNLDYDIDKSDIEHCLDYYLNNDKVREYLKDEHEGDGFEELTTWEAFREQQHGELWDAVADSAVRAYEDGTNRQCKRIIEGFLSEITICDSNGYALFDKDATLDHNELYSEKDCFVETDFDTIMNYIKDEDEKEYNFKIDFDFGRGRGLENEFDSEGFISSMKDLGFGGYLK